MTLPMGHHLTGRCVVATSPRLRPEHRDWETLCYPFPTDVYYLGNFVREDYMERYDGLEFMQPLISDMIQEDPAKRPNMDEIVARFSEIRNKLSTWNFAPG
ncbi:hypothetical protein EDB89DRAFT_2023475 [Lactarius sanguifluus]|nr:hypothetical protein EDB89DRAFT_2023475 [Lactarius sanguifluus]